MITIIPAIDLIAGECIRLTQGDYSRKMIYARDPVDVARRYEDAGLRRLHVVDLDGARSASPVNLNVLSRIAAATRLDIEYGGGIKSETAVRAAFDHGAARVICGSVAVASPELFAEWLERYGGRRIILGADLRDGRVATHGWLRSSDTTVETLIDRFAAPGLRQTVCTDISRDGMLSSPAFDLYAGLQTRYPELEVTVSGGIASMDDIRRLDEMGLRSVIVGKALYEGRITLEEISRCLPNE